MSQLLQSLGAFPNLTTLFLHHNDFTGRKLELRNLSSLESLYLDQCSIDEHSLQSLGALRSLKNLSLSALSSSVPSGGFLHLKNLKFLNLSSNTLNNNSILQTIGLCDLNNLQELHMYHNNLSGFLPPCLANLTYLQHLDLSSNHLKIPLSWSPLYNLSKLKHFNGSGNEIFTEKYDYNLSPKFQLESLYLNSHGQGARAFFKFLYHQVNLQYMDLTNIQIKGEFPNWLIENNTYLQELHLENCSLSGPFYLPKNSHVNLSFLSISMNHFQGQIPSEIGARLPGLEVLLMSDNGFNGSIPFSLGNISSLQVLDLSNNSLQGKIPIWIWNMPSLELLDLSRNNFFGRLPPRFNASSKLRHVYLSRNKLQGPITMAFCDSSEIFALDLSHNNLTEIPPEIGNLNKIKALNLSHNSLTGPIPPTFSKLKEIESLDLSYNKLDGEIPPQLIELFFLEVFNVAHNNLSGKTLARVAQFSTFEESCYKDNPFLCGEPLPKKCGGTMPTSSNNEDNGGFMDMEVFYVSFGVAYIMVLVVICAVLHINPYWRRAWFHFIEVNINNCYYFLVENLPILSKFRFS
ncbi:hypothetical protein BDE02_18G118400 [Populus trichocarpa]|nr:hypothetical protein BDE02_18G118400 [Populus trichocarpa]